MVSLNTHFFGWNLPKGCQAQLDNFVKDGHRILCVAFPPDRADAWSIITDKTFANRNIPSECDQRMREIRNGGKRVQAVAFPHKRSNSFSIITDDGVFNRNIPASCDTKMRALEADGHRIVGLGFPPENRNGWCIITDRDVASSSIDPECDERMQALQAAGQRITGVSFHWAADNKWTLTTDRGMFNRRIGHRCHRTMRAFRGLGAFPLACVAHGPAGGFVVVGSATPFQAKGPALVQPNGKRFSIDAMLAELVAQMDGNAVKYGVVLRHGNAVRTAVDGPARIAGTPPARDFTVFDWFNPASVTKTISSVAMLQLLDAQNLPITTRIHDYLPPTWAIGPNVTTITMAELLNHSSGFRGGALEYGELREMVQQGVTLADKTEKYCNCNTALARIVIAYLDGHKHNLLSDGEATAARFIAVVQKNIFDPLGIPEVGWTKDEEAPTLFFSDPPMVAGTAYGDFRDKPGSAGSHLSLAELVSFLHALSQGETLLPGAMRTVMRESQLGMARAAVDFGGAMRKRGYFPPGKNGGAQLNSGIWWFSSGVLAAAVSNGDREFKMERAFNRAWEDA